MWNAYYLYKKKLNKDNYRYIDFHSDVITKLLHLPENIIHDSQLVSKKNIRIRTSNRPRNTSVVLEHVQEKIPHPPGIIFFIIIIKDGKLKNLHYFRLEEKNVLFKM